MHVHQQTPYTGVNRQGYRLAAAVFLLIFFSSVAHTQNLVRLWYWFDDQGQSNATQVNFSPAPELNLNFTIPLTGLSYGFHTLHFGAMDEELSWSQLNHVIIFNEQYVDPQITKIEYFIDSDTGPGTGTPVSFSPGTNVSNVAFPVDLAGIPNGLHHLIIRGQDQNGVWSMSNHRVILCEPAMQNIVQAEYFLDTDPGEGNGIQLAVSPSTDVNNLVFDLDLNTVTPGLHHLFIRAKDAFGRWSITTDRIIICEPAMQNIVQAEYFMDTDPGEGNGIQLAVSPSTDVNNLVFDLNLNSVTPGLHHLFIRAKDAFGRWSMTNNKVIVCESGLLPDIVKAEYFIDTDPGTGLGADIPVTPGTNISNLVFQVDLSAYAAGIHRLFIRARDMYGKWSQTNTGEFEFIPLSKISLKAFLEGAFADAAMTNYLNLYGYLPLEQPYNESPWNYSGTENVAAIPGPEIVDWVLVELRETTGDANSATVDKTIVRKAGFVLQNGNIVGLDGSNKLLFNNTITGNLYAVVWHRNHVGTMSANPLTASSGMYSYDFTTAQNQAFGDNLKEMNGLYVIYSGDVNHDGAVDGLDMIPLDNQAANFGSGYLPEDLNADGSIDALDMIIADNNAASFVSAVLP